MAELKTKVNDANVTDFLNSVSDEKKRADAFKLLELMQTVTGEAPKMWGNSIIGFGQRSYTYASGRTGEWMLVAFSPRKQNLTLYGLAGFEGYQTYLERLGTYKTGKSCLYIKRLSDIDIDVLETLISAAVQHIKASDKQTSI